MQKWLKMASITKTSPSRNMTHESWNAGAFCTIFRKLVNLESLISRQFSWSEPYPHSFSALTLPGSLAGPSLFWSAQLVWECLLAVLTAYRSLERERRGLVQSLSVLYCIFCAVCSLRLKEAPLRTSLVLTRFYVGWDASLPFGTSCLNELCSR